MLYARRARLTTTAAWALGLFALSVAGAIAAAFAGYHARREAERKIASLAVADELTQLNNRRGFMMLAGHEHRLAQRQGRGLLLVSADLDGLKAINDGLGHEQGDATSKRAYRLAASLGTTILAPGDALTLEQLVTEADRAMYERKRAKRRT